MRRTAGWIASPTPNQSIPRRRIWTKYASLGHRRMLHCLDTLPNGPYPPPSPQPESSAPFAAPPSPPSAAVALITPPLSRGNAFAFFFMVSSATRSVLPTPRPLDDDGTVDTFHNGTGGGPPHLGGGFTGDGDAPAAGGCKLCICCRSGWIW